LHQEIRRTLQQSQNTKSLDGMDIALLSIQQKDTHTEIAYAGAMNSLYYVQNDEIKEIKADKKAIGGQHYPNETQRLFTKHTLVLPKENKENTVFYLATDGFADQFGGQEKRKFMTKRLRELLLQIAKKPMQTQKKILETTIIDWTTVANEKQTDDITILGIRL
jgi:serine phosphatase RsbU (regulator of sigma subunit)